MLLVPLALSAPGGPPEAGDEVVLAAGWPEGADAEAGDAAFDDVGTDAADDFDPDDSALNDENSTSASLWTIKRRSTAGSRPSGSATTNTAKAKAKAKVTTTTTAKVSDGGSTIRAAAAGTATAAAGASTPPPPPPPPPQPPPPPAAASGGDSAWDRLAQCESGNMNDPGAPYYGYWQFSAATWQSVDEPGLPNEHSRQHQLAAAKRLQASRGWAPWPECSRRLGLR